MTRRIVSLAVTLLVAVPAAALAEGVPDTALSETAVRKIFRIVTGQPQLKDEEIGVSVDPNRTWTCIWTPEGDGEVIVLQVRDTDGAYRRPDFTDLSSLKFGMRLDLKERIAAIVAEDRKED